MLSPREHLEFEALDVLPFDDSGNVAWAFEGEPATGRENAGRTVHEASATLTGAGIGHSGHVGPLLDQ
jgi:hypothetical protein